MILKNKVQAVLKIYRKLETDTALFQSASGLSCKPGCGACCTYPEIYAAPLEFLPYAFHQYHAGMAEDKLEQLKTEFAELKTCCLYSHSQLALGPGGCLEYEFRGLVCRIFGFGTMTMKDGRHSLIACKILKEKHPAIFDQSESSREKLRIAPIAANYYLPLASIDYELSEKQLPVNSAIIKALEYVVAYYSYRKKKQAID